MRFSTILVLCLCVSAQGQQFKDDGDTLYGAALESYRHESYADAAESYQRCYELAITPVAHAVSAHGSGVALFKLGRAEEAEAWLQRALQVWPSVTNTADETARTALWLVEAERTLGHFGTVESTLRVALAAHPAPELEAEIHNRLAVILRETDKIEDSERELNLVMAMPQATADQHIDALIEVGEIAARRLHFSESRERFEKALSLAYDRSNQGAQSDALQGLGMAWANLGDLSRAAPALKRAAALAVSPQQEGTALQHLASLSARQEKYALAEEQLLLGLERLRRTLREEHPQIAALKGDLAQVYLLQNNLPEAKRYADEAWSAISAALGPHNRLAEELLRVKAEIDERIIHSWTVTEAYAAVPKP